MNKKQLNVVLTTGFALFAMFFGAGNLILPPYLGLMAHQWWWLTFFGFALTAIVAPLLTIVMISSFGRSFKDLEVIFPRWLLESLLLLVVLIIGPLVAIPRTTAVAYEVGLKDFAPELPKIVFVVFYIVLAAWLSISKTKLIDIIGKYLTPVLLVALLLLIVMGVVKASPIEINKQITATSALFSGMVEGFQALDVLGAVMFSGLIIGAVIEKGYTDPRYRQLITLQAGMVSSVALLLIYGGLLYMGATEVGLHQADVTRTELLKYLAQKALGDVGLWVVSVCICFACLTTAIALTSCTADFFERVSAGKINYRMGVIATAVVSFVLAILSVDDIIRYAGGVLSVLYPVILCMIFYVLLFKNLVREKLPYIIVVVFCIVFQLVLELSRGVNISKVVEYFEAFPMSSHSLGWFLPSLVVFFVSYFYVKKKGGKKPSL